ncbi:helix-turn-helix domain-containing protein [Plantactinospora sp. KBS50]|uniref:helix-turn-helix domain-containing protein n=1 Tax=Plantactinospora sp. KBS50 TaxID=2024580 RepID=UPI0018E011D2|nr:helix-turn-helix domain-containing protein [Plantactinospora sp. KBS50]
MDNDRKSQDRDWAAEAEPISFGAELRRRRIAAGLSLTQLGDLTHYSEVISAGIR